MCVKQEGLNRTIMAIAVPAFAALISEPLMLAADTAIVGHLGREELAALGASSTVLSTIIGLCIFLAYSSTAVVARQQGAGNRSAAMSSAMGAIWLAAGLGVVLAIIIHLTAGATANAFSSSEEVRNFTESYLGIAAWSIPAALVVMATTGALRGVLDLRTPLIVMISANIANVLITLLLVFGLTMGLKGAASGLVLAQWFAAMWLLFVVRKHVRGAGVRSTPNITTIAAAISDGFALLVRTATLRAVLLIATWLASNLGDAALAAHQIVMTIVLMSSFALDAIAIAGQTLIGRSLGAGDVTETRIITSTLMRWGSVGGLAMGLAIGISCTLIPMVFSRDELVQSTTTPALIVVAITMPLSGLVYILDGVLIGAGDSCFLAWAGIITLIAYLPMAAWVHLTNATFVALWIAYGLFMAVRLVTLWLRQQNDDWLIVGARVR